MNSESMELWDAMKSSKYRDTLTQLHNVKLDENTSLATYMTSVLGIVAKAVHAVAGTLWYYDRFLDGRIHAEAVYGGGDLVDISLKPGEGIAGSVIQTGKGVLVSDCQQDPRWSGKADENTGFVTKTMICEPIKDENQCFGCIQLINRTDGNFFDEKDCAFLATLCAEISGRLKEHLVGGYSKKLDASLMAEALEAKDITTMLAAVHKLSLYETLGIFGKWQYDCSWKKLWKLAQK